MEMSSSVSLRRSPTFFWSDPASFNEEIKPEGNLIRLPLNNTHLCNEFLARS